MEKRIIARGLLAGAIGGVVAFVFAPHLRRAGHRAGDRLRGRHGRTRLQPGARARQAEVFTRGVQANIGMGFGVLAFGVAMGALFAVVFCVVYGRVGNLSARDCCRCWWPAACCSSLYLVPFLKYPPNPPAIGLDETIRAAHRCCIC